MNKIISLLTQSEYSTKPKLEFYQSNTYEILLSAKLDMNPRECKLSERDCKSILKKIEKLELDISNMNFNMDKLANLNKWDAYIKIYNNQNDAHDKLNDLIEISKHKWYNSKQYRLFV